MKNFFRSSAAQDESSSPMGGGSDSSPAERFRAERPWEQKALPPRRLWRMMVPGIALCLVVVAGGAAYFGMQRSTPLPASLLPGGTSEEAPAPAQVFPVCGDSAQDESEQCDDGNTNDGDGCSKTCTPEEGWVCSTLPCKRIEVCGDSIVSGTESCDDGNAAAGDGCSPTCALETEKPIDSLIPAADPGASPASESEDLNS